MDTDNTMNLSVKDRLILVAGLRAHEAEARAGFQNARQAVLDAFDSEHATAKTELEAISLELCAQTAALKEAVAAEYKSSPAIGKKPYPGVTVCVGIGYDYDPTEAFRWAKEHALCLSLDTTAFKSLCKTKGACPDFVTIDDNVVTVKLDTDLDKALAEG
jgi:hypothetical protein